MTFTVYASEIDLYKSRDGRVVSIDDDAAWLQVAYVARAACSHDQRCGRISREKEAGTKKFNLKTKKKFPSRLQLQNKEDENIGRLREKFFRLATFPKV